MTKADLIRAGWTRTAIARFLGEPDYTVRNSHNPDRPECHYSVARTDKAKKKRFRSEKRTWRRAVWRPRVNVHHEPQDWLPGVTVKDLNIRPPWTVQRIEYAQDDHALHVYLDYEPGTKWPCPKCLASCGIYDHRPTRILRTVRAGDIECVLHGRLPRCSCPKHGVRTIPPLFSIHSEDIFLQADYPVGQWVIRRDC